MSVKTEGILAGFGALLVVRFYELWAVVLMIFSADNIVWRHSIILSYLRSQVCDICSVSVCC